VVRRRIFRVSVSVNVTWIGILIMPGITLADRKHPCTADGGGNDGSSLAELSAIMSVAATPTTEGGDSNTVASITTTVDKYGTASHRIFTQFNHSTSSSCSHATPKETKSLL
jgi:hypothetical protein